MSIGLPLALTVAAVTFLLGVIWGGPFVTVLRLLKVGKQVRVELQDMHTAKIGTPTMGGIMIILPTVIILLALNVSSMVLNGTGASVLLPLFVMIGFAGIGFIDDWEGIQTSRGRVGEGLSPRVKFGMQVVVAGIAAGAFSLYQGGFAYANQVVVPLIGVTIDIPPLLFIPIMLFIILATSNAVNLTDGLDGLAGIILASAVGAYGAIAFLQGQIFVVQLCFILAGACFAFLWYNAHPAQLFMGDTGSLALGATLGIIAMMTGQWMLLPIIAIVPVAEALSVILQVASARLSRRYLGEDIRPFRRAPLHHHFEMVGWSETQVVQRFWLVAILSAMIGGALALV
jgi:phospho-N-acetylmuramoyl-pentapeptide-transferase